MNYIDTKFLTNSTKPELHIVYGNDGWYLKSLPIPQTLYVSKDKEKVIQEGRRYSILWHLKLKIHDKNEWKGKKLKK
ncbi:MAG: hypothetical protein RLZZ422_1232 [Pseudomonadota bacterium]|jgi:hypothetical protein